MSQRQEGFGWRLEQVMSQQRMLGSAARHSQRGWRGGRGREGPLRDPSQGGTAEEQQAVVSGSSLEKRERKGRNLFPVIPETLGGFPYLKVLKV